MEEHLMKTDNPQKLRADRVWLTEDACDLADFRTLAEKTTTLADYPTADSVERNVLIYDSAKVLAAIASPDGRRAVLAEICEAFGEGPGVVVFKRAYEDTSVIDRASVIFDDIIKEQHRTATISPSRVPTTASGIRWKNTASPIQPISQNITAMPLSRLPAKPGSDRATR
jgi:hypothetical protein